MTLNLRALLKRNLRLKYKQMLTCLHPYVLLALSNNINKRLIALVNSLKPRAICIYSPIYFEPNLDLLIEYCKAKDILIALRLITANKVLAYTAVLDETFKVGSFGILESASNIIVSPEVLIIPCIAYDSSLYRLGYGGGYFDRTLAEYKNIISIGVAYSSMEYSLEFGEHHDIAMSYIVTYKGIKHQ